jgi:quercetin dioxygenase-like cupin family protein
MVSRTGLILAAVVVLAAAQGSGVVRAQDTLQVNSDSVHLKLENSRVRVLEVVLRPEGKEKLHSHPWPYLVYVIKGGTVQTHFPDGKVVTADLKAGDVIYRDPVTHWGENVGASEIYEIMVELKPQQ